MNPRILVVIAMLIFVIAAVVAFLTNEGIDTVVGLIAAGLATWAASSVA